MTTTTRLPAMTGAEFRTIREQLGLTNQWLADHLGVAVRSVERWGDDVVTPPHGVVKALLELEAAAADEIERGLAEISDAGDGAVWITYRTETGLQAALSTYPYPAGWHRAIAGRLRAAVPGLRLEYGDYGDGGTLTTGYVAPADEQ